jgi:bile salt-stimulated lipase
VDLYSDLHFKFPSVAESEMYAKTTNQNIYYYMFKYSGSLNIVKFISYFIGVEGASHADELFYMIRPQVLPTPQRSRERVMMSRMLTMWTNFAKFR